MSLGRRGVPGDLCAALAGHRDRCARRPPGSTYRTAFSHCSSSGTPAAAPSLGPR